MPVSLTETEQRKFDVITAVIQKHLTNKQAAKQLGLSIRQVRRLKSAVKVLGTDALVHKLKGKASNHRIDQGLKEKLLGEIKNKYGDFKPGFATEKLQETYGVNVTSQTIRTWMTQAGLWKIHSQKAIIYRSWRL